MERAIGNCRAASTRVKLKNGYALGYPAVQRIRHIDIARAIHCDTVRRVKPRRATDAVRAVLFSWAPRQGGDHAPWANFPNSEIASIRYIDIPGSIRRDASRLVEFSRGACQRCNRSVERDLPNPGI